MEKPKLTLEQADKYTDALTGMHCDLECDCDGIRECTIQKLINFLTDSWFYLREQNDLSKQL